KPVSFYHPESVSSKRYLTAAEKIWGFIEKINNEGGADNSAIQPVMNGKSACSH
ncbi:sodium:proton antiporter, partial [Campylobacter jejuni]|nr:sodium:proton antiporter [Campylobacter jejuni]